MKRPTEIVQELIESSDFAFDEIYENSIPLENRDASNVTQILLTESEDMPSDYGNSSFVRFNYGVYIQIFYSVETEVDTISSELSLMQFLESKGWLVTQSKPRMEDPDTHQIIKNLTVQKSMTLSEIANS